MNWIFWTSNWTSLTSDQLVQINPVVGHAHREAVGLRDIVNVVHRDHRPGARHVLHDDLGIAGNVFRHIAGEHAGPAIIKAARRQTHDNADALAFVERFALSTEAGDP